MAYEFNGTNQRLSTGNVYGNSPSEISMAVWHRRNGTGKGYIYSHRTAAILFAFNYSTSNRVRFFFRNSGFAVQASLTAATGTTDLVWTHLGATVNATDGAKFFIDGVQVGSDATVSMANNDSTTSTIGSNGNEQFFKGECAEAAVWLGTLTAAEIASLARGMTCDKVRPQSLVFYAPLVRDLNDQKGGLTITNNNGATVANHPRVYA
jgi:hypothetical protein